MLSFDVEKTMLPSSSPSDLNGGLGHSPSPPASQPEVKQEPGDERSNSCSPIIRVCDSPESSMSSPQSPLSTSLYSNYSAGAAIGMPSPHSPPSLGGHHMGGLPPNLPPIPNPFLFRPFFSMPLPLLPQLAAAQNAVNQPQFTPTSLSAGGNKPLPFSIDNILRTNFQNLAGGLDQKPILPLGGIGPDTTPHSLATSMAGNLTPKQSSSPPVVQPKPSKPAQPKKKMDIEIPVDLSKTSNEAPKTDSDCPPGMVRGPNGQLWPAWVFCTRYSDRPSSGPRARKQKRQIDPNSTLDIDRVRKMKKKGESNHGGSGGLGGGGGGLSGGPGGSNNSSLADDKRPRTAFTTDQLNKLRQEFQANRYLTEERRRLLSRELGLNENQIKIWFQNKRAKLKKASGDKGDLAKMLEAQGLYNHQTVPIDDDEYPGY